MNEEAASEHGEASAAPVHAVLTAIADNVDRVITGQQATVRKLVAAFAAGGHVLLEDFPGTGKTTLAKALARSITADFQRVQFTPDLLPSDILGVSIYDPRSQSFRLHRGPVFTTILLADEINRASPRTQAALLEAMAESQVSLEGVTHRLDPLFFVIATQNPIEFHGTYPLPEAQMDRFAMRLSLGYVAAEEEVGILTSHSAGEPVTTLAPVASVADMQAVRMQLSRVGVSDEIKRYIVDLVAASRELPGVQMGASPRASLTLMKCAQALALLDELSFVTPDHVQSLAVPVLAHRLVVNAEARFGGASAPDLVGEILQRVPVPR